MLKVCIGNNCRKNNSQEILKIINAAVKESTIVDKFNFLGVTLCTSHCEDGPTLLYKNTIRCRVTLEDAYKIAAMINDQEKLDEFFMNTLALQKF